jgi:hypothetical protein
VSYLIPREERETTKKAKKTRLQINNFLLLVYGKKRARFKEFFLFFILLHIEIDIFSYEEMRGIKIGKHRARARSGKVQSAKQELNIKCS